MNLNSIESSRLKSEDEDNAPLHSMISLVVPVYNAKSYLASCLDSIVHQTYQNFELILVDDGSTDGSGDQCDGYAAKDERIHVIHTPNCGPGAARNTGIEASKGDFILFVDADDLLERDALNALLEGYRGSGADIVVSDFIKMHDNETQESGHQRVFSESMLLTSSDIVTYVRSYLSKPNRFSLFIYCWGRLFKASIIRDNHILFDPELKTFEDIAFNISCLRFIDKVYFHNVPLYKYRQPPNYLLSAALNIRNNPQKLFGHRQGFQYIERFLIDVGMDIEVIRQEVGHADTSLTIVQMVRMCWQINGSNYRTIYRFLDDLINNEEFRIRVSYYRPTGGDSKLIPSLIKARLVLLVMLICTLKAVKRYSHGR